MSPRERFNRLYNRVMQAAQSGDEATVTRFTPMALMAYAQLDTIDGDARYHAALLRVHTGDVEAARALADTILADSPGHLFGYIIQGTVARFPEGRQGDRPRLSRLPEALRCGDEGRAAGVREHQRSLDDFRKAALQAVAASGRLLTASGNFAGVSSFLHGVRARLVRRSRASAIGLTPRIQDEAPAGWEGAMTAAAAIRTSATSEIKTPMLPFLQGVHERWVREVRSVVDPSRHEDAGVWIRWRAIQYLTTSFARRLERERQAVVSLHGHLTGAQAETPLGSRRAADPIPADDSRVVRDYLTIYRTEFLG